MCSVVEQLTTPKLLVLLPQRAQYLQSTAVCGVRRFTLSSFDAARCSNAGRAKHDRQFMQRSVAPCLPLTSPFARSEFVVVAQSTTVSCEKRQPSGTGQIVKCDFEDASIWIHLFRKP